MYYAINYFLRGGGETATVIDMAASCVPTHIFNVTFWDTFSGSLEKMASTYSASLCHQHTPTILLLTCRYIRGLLPWS